ncbi:OmpW family protein [Oxalobacteraceae bacterium]|nr:OmpW family protein [Oxalobacteraceae bacterium]
MTKRFNRAAQLLALAAAMTAASAASAQSSGNWLVTAGINKITPKVDSGNVSAPSLPNTKADIDADTKPRVALAYMVTDNLSAELDLGMPYKHNLSGAGAIEGTGKIGTAEVLPPTAFVQYRFLAPNAMFRPYVGAGLTYAYFQKETGSAKLTAILNPGGPATTFKLDNKLAGSVQVGGTVRINERWFADATVIKTFLKTTAHYSTGQTQDVTLNPLSVSVSIGYKF